MRILLATPLYPPDSGGPSTYAKLLVDELPKRGIEVSLLKFGEVRHLPPGVRHVAYFLKCLAHTRGVDAVYALDPVSVGLPAALAAFVMGKKFMLRVPGDYAWEQGRQRFGVVDEIDEFQHKKYGRGVERLRGIQKFVARRAQKIVVPSEYMRRVVSGWVTDAKKVEVIYSSIHVPVEFVLPKERPSGFLVITIARRVPWKGIEALEKVVARESSWHFKLLDGLPHNEAMGWVKVADAFALNSTYEGLSHALVEAMALGTPVVATNVGGNPELITPGETGLLIPPKDDEALHAALKNIEQHPDEAHSRAVRAKERAQQFSIDMTIKKLVTLLSSI
ncbi:MAG TPA: glycosyltransferase family 4 protein [Candidatus Paceibacterota bacterium]